MEKINAYARTPLSPDEVYTFSVLLCDNEVDRDCERFTVDALYKLKDLFVGKPGIFDHRASSKEQTARIYETFVTEDLSRRTSQGEPYTALRAKAYLLKNERNEGLISDINGGIVKEVSVSCSISERRCSICGADLLHEGCAHRVGEEVGGALCHVILDEPSDAYEFSFVAIPAQTAAGVTKACKNSSEIKKALASETAEITLTRDACETLDTLAKAGARYQEKLRGEVVSLCHSVLPSLSGELAKTIAAGLSIPSLEEFSSALQKRAEAGFPLPQTARKQSETPDLSGYQI